MILFVLTLILFHVLIYIYSKLIDNDEFNNFFDNISENEYNSDESFNKDQLYLDNTNYLVTGDGLEKYKKMQKAKKEFMHNRK